ncbi:alpha-2-macroglobulin family protein [Haloferula sp.]|uniref:alpha-2-macroglobulin family protein n=1 Tax=Haloferula sp. TaxID=2497595 RepID=UPI003C739401
MKHLLFLLALISPALADPRLHVPNKAITPGVEIELVLDQAACPDDRIGKVAATPWLEIKPAWPGKTLWKEANVLRFVPTAPPAIGTAYTFSLVGEHIYLDGSKVPNTNLGTYSTPSFQIEYATMLERYSNDWSPRNATWFLRFNDEVEPSKAAPFLVFESKEGKRVAARTTRATMARVKHAGYNRKSFSQLFSESIAGASSEPDLSPNAEIPNGLIIEPSSPLPIGKEWRLAILSGLPGKSSKYSTDTVRHIGDISPFALQKSIARVTPDNPRRIILDFSAKLPAEIEPSMITLSPEVSDLRIETRNDELHLIGDFSSDDQWNVAIDGRLASHDGRALGKSISQKLVFEHLKPQLGLPSQDETQLATGSRRYRLSTVNLDKLKVRVKKLSGRQLIRAQQGYRYYTGRGPDSESIEPTRLIPYEMMGGKTIAEFDVPLDNAIDTSRLVILDWNKILAGEKTPFEIGEPTDEQWHDRPGHEPQNAAAFFLEVIGTPKDGTEARKSPSGQALIQLTDIGMAWKITDTQSQVYAFSCLTGQPLPKVKIETFGEDAEPLDQFITDANGLATLPRNESIRHLRASLGRDQFTAPYDSAMPTVGLWRFPVRYSWDEPPLATRRVFLFTDRSLYRPQETVHLKGIIRQQNGNTIEAAGPAKPKLTITNPTGREILSRDLEVSANGSIDASFQLPPETVGYHSISVTWPDELKAAEAIESWTARSQAVQNARFQLGLRVEEFRRNAFEIKHALTEPAPGASEVTLDLTATYYQGQPVAKGKAATWTRVTEQNFYPERYRDFLFGDHRTPDFNYWYHYFGYRWDDDHGNRNSDSQSAELELSEDGTTRVTANIPEAEFPMAREVTIQTEVTDANNQTLTKTTNATVHPASVYVGVKRLDRLVRVGDKLPLEIIAVTPDGKSFDGTLDLTAKLSREINEQVRVQNESGGSAVRNEPRKEDISTTPLNIAENGSTEFLFAPTNSGLHTLEIRGTDSADHPFATAMTIHVYGTDQYPWAYEDSMRIKLVPEKKLYQPGDTARVLVLSPIEGTALITVEREDVSKSFLVELKATDPVIEIPVTDLEAPNCYVSVLVIKGAQDSLRKHKEPQLRLGYCELTVENQRDRLAVTLNPITTGEAADSSLITDHSALGTPSASEVLPGSEITITGQVLLSNKQPATGAEVTLYAEDEGTLAVVGYETPDPMAHFYDPRLLRVQCGTSLGNFIPEAPDEQTFYNKGFFIGGGDGDFGPPLDMPRRDFNPCAFWKPSLTTDATGKFSATVKLPDTLTRYRLIAVAHHQASRFGHAESEFTVAKPLMVEPQTPRFAHETDTINTQAKITNASDYEGTWLVTFTPNPPASDPIAKSAPEQGSVGVPPTSSTLEEQITLAPGKSKTVSFPVTFTNTGEAIFKWEATPVSLTTGNLTPALTRRLSDSVENHFQVEYPVPLQRQTKLIRHTKESGNVNLLKDLDPKLLEGRGHLDIEISRSLLLEAGGAIDHLLHYPYGCVEQTTSSLIPWLAVEQLRAVSPSLAKHSEAEVKKAIQAGIDRLLSMQQRDGGFSYWPGNQDSLSWASSYAGLGLILASEQGDVPPAALSSLTNYLIEDLRNVGKADNSYDYEIATRHLWILAIAGKAQDSYVNLLKDRLPQLNSRARSLLALAENAAGHQEAAIAILRDPSPFTGKDHSWMRWQPDHAYRLLAWSSVDPSSDEATTAIDKLLRDRNPYGHWNTTWTNAWSLVALSAYAKAEENLSPTTLVLNDGTEPLDLTLDSSSAAASKSFTLTPNLKLTATADGPAFIRINLAAKPKIAPMQPVAKNGLQVTRFYERVNSDGTSEPLDTPKVGDLIRVKLRVTLPDDDLRYLVIEDMLPSLFETVNNSFESQSANMNAGGTSENEWSVSHSELRDDRALFFLDRAWRNDTKTLTYLARVTLSGQALAPPAKVESMYDPENLALSASREFKVGE